MITAHLTEVFLDWDYPYLKNISILVTEPMEGHFTYHCC